MPSTPFMGVRISWLMLARNSLLARLAASADSLARLELAGPLGDRGLEILGVGLELLPEPGALDRAGALHQQDGDELLRGVGNEGVALAQQAHEHPDNPAAGS